MVKQTVHVVLRARPSDGLPKQLSFSNKVPLQLRNRVSLHSLRPEKHQTPMQCYRWSCRLSPLQMHGWEGRSSSMRCALLPPSRRYCGCRKLPDCRHMRLSIDCCCCPQFKFDQVLPQASQEETYQASLCWPFMRPSPSTGQLQLCQGA